MKPIVVINPSLVSMITFGFARGITLWPFILIRDDDEILLRHEKIHIKQQAEMFVLFFYLWYGIEYLIRFLKYKKFEPSYKNISFEKEAYSNAKNPEYLINRKAYSWTKYL